MSLSIRLVSECGYDCFISTTSSPLSLLTALPTTSNPITAPLHDIYWTAAAQRSTWSFGNAVMSRRNSDPRGPFSKEVGSELCGTREPSASSLENSFRLLGKTVSVFEEFFTTMIRSHMDFFSSLIAFFWNTLITWPLLKPQRVLEIWNNYLSLCGLAN